VRLVPLDVHHIGRVCKELRALPSPETARGHPCRVVAEAVPLVGNSEEVAPAVTMKTPSVRKDGGRVPLVVAECRRGSHRQVVRTTAIGVPAFGCLASSWQYPAVASGSVMTDPLGNSVMRLSSWSSSAYIGLPIADELIRRSRNLPHHNFA